MEPVAVKGYNVLWCFCYKFAGCGAAHKVCVLHAYGSDAGQNEFGLEGYGVSGSEDIARARGYYRQLVDFYAHAVPYEARVAAVPHEVFLHSGLACHFKGAVVEVGGGGSGSHHAGQSGAYVGREAVRFFHFRRHGSGGEAAGHVGHIAGVVSVHVHHNRQSGTDYSAVGADRQRRIQSGAAHGEVVGRRGIGVVAGEHIAHEDFHLGSCAAENAQASFQARGPFDFNLQFDVGHPRFVEAWNA